MLKIRCAVVGDSGVGKSCFLKAYTNPNYKVVPSDYTPTKIEKYSAQVNSRGTTISVEFLDIGGDVRDGTKMYDETDCFLLCFSVISPKSFEDVETKWMQLLSQYRNNAAFLIVGCKVDYREDKDVTEKLKERNITPISWEMGSELSKKLAALGYMECSAARKFGVKEIFDKAITSVVLRRKKAESENGQKQKTEEHTSTNYQDGTVIERKPEVKEEEPEKLTIQAILKKGDFTIKDLLAENVRGDLMKEFRHRNKVIIALLAQRETLVTLISYFSDSTKTQNEQFSACEMLTADISPILDAFCAEPQPLWRNLFQFFITTKPPVNGITSVTFLVRVACFIMNHRSIEFIQYLKSNRDLLAYLVDHIGTDSVVQLLITMVECEIMLEKNAMWEDLIVSNELVPLLSQKFSNPAALRDEDVTGIMEFIDALVKKHPTSLLLRRFQDGPLVDELLKYSLYESHSRAEEYLQIFIKIVKTCTNTQDYLRKDIPQVIVKIIQDDDEDVDDDSEEAVKRMEEKMRQREEAKKNGEVKEKPLQRLYHLLYQRAGPLPASITTTAGFLSPLGFFRLRCVEFLLELIRANYHALDTEIMDCKLVARVTDLFFQYKWNNVLHTLVEQMARVILETKPTYFCLYLLRDCHLVDRILQAQQNEDQERTLRQEEEKWIPHLGYMGHLYAIANVIVQSSKTHSAIYYVLEDVPNRAWKKFVDGKLKQVNVDQTRPEGIPVVERKGTFSLRD